MSDDFACGIASIHTIATQTAKKKNWILADEFLAKNIIELREKEVENLTGMTS